jgi:DNA-binding GntR family transcriptional regulator
MSKYVDIANQLIAMIEAGEYRSWGVLEGELYLTRLFSASRVTIRKALTLLKDKGYIHSRQGSGYYVNPPEFYKEQHLTTLSDRYDNMNLSSAILTFDIEDATDELTKMFHLFEGQKLYHYRRIRLIDDIPVALEETWMPVSLFEDFNESNLYGSVMQYIESRNNVISHDFKRIQAVQLSSETARHLRKEEQSLSLQIIHKVYLLKSVLAQYTIETQADNHLNALSIR